MEDKDFVAGWCFPTQNTKMANIVLANVGTQHTKSWTKNDAF